MNLSTPVPSTRFDGEVQQIVLQDMSSPVPALHDDTEDKQDAHGFSKKCCAWARENCEKIVLLVFLWMAYTLCSMAYSTINPFFPQIV